MYTQRYLSDKVDKEELSDHKSSPRAVPVQKEESQHVRLRNGKMDDTYFIRIAKPLSVNSRVSTKSNYRRVQCSQK